MAMEKLWTLGILFLNTCGNKDFLTILDAAAAAAAKNKKTQLICCNIQFTSKRKEKKNIFQMETKMQGFIQNTL